MASIEKRGENSYRLVVESGYDAAGKRQKKYKPIKIEEKLTPKKLKDYLNEELLKFKIEVEAGEYISPEKMAFVAFSEEWRSKYALKEYSAKSMELNDYLLSHINPHIGRLKLCDIKPMHIVQLFGSVQEGRKKPLSANTLTSMHRLLRVIFNTAIAWQLITKSPMAGLKYPKKMKSKTSFYDENESLKLLTTLEEEPLVWRALIVVAITTGLRRGEICGLEWKHINLDKKFIEIDQQLVYTKATQKIVKAPKSEGANRKVSIPQMAVDLLADVRSYTKKEKFRMGSRWKNEGEHDFVFRTGTGSSFTPEYLSSKWRDFLKAKELRHINFHALRHTSASLLINEGIHAKVISERLGHSDIGITMNTYGHVFKKADEVAANTFDDIFQQNKKSVPNSSPDAI